MPDIWHIVLKYEKLSVRIRKMAEEIQDLDKIWQTMCKLKKNGGGEVT